MVKAAGAELPKALASSSCALPRAFCSGTSRVTRLSLCTVTAEGSSGVPLMRAQARVEKPVPSTVIRFGPAAAEGIVGGVMPRITGAPNWGPEPPGSKGQALESEAWPPPGTRTSTSPGPAAGGMVTVIEVRPAVEDRPADP